MVSSSNDHGAAGRDEAMQPESQPAARRQGDASEGRMDPEFAGRLRAVVESLLFAADRPVPTGKMAEIINAACPGEFSVDGHTIRREIDVLRKEYDEQRRAFQIEEIAGGFRMLTRPEYHQWVLALSSHRQQTRLSPAAVETLAIIAYKQPVSRATIEDIRGVQCGHIIRTLMEKRLVKVLGREEVPGRPLLYGTTREFLDHFGLKSIKELPTTEELPKEP